MMLRPCRDLGCALAMVVVVGCATAEPPPEEAAATRALHPLEAYEGGAKEIEDQYIGALARFFGRPAEPGEPLRRGTHARGSCVVGTFAVADLATDDPAVQALAQGVFARPGIYGARVRFSNGLGTPPDPAKGFDDRDYDARALAFQIEVADGQRQDFVLQNSPIFPVWPLQGFLLTVQLGIAKAQGQSPQAFIGQLPPDQKAMLQKLLDNVRQYQRAPGEVVPTFTPTPDAYRLETYWSGKAHRLGPDLVVKYGATPCATNGTDVPTRAVPFAERASDFLRQELVRHVTTPAADEAPACFDVHVQPLQADRMTGSGGQTLPADQQWRWVEDTTLEWREVDAPAYPVGKLTLTGPMLAPADCDDPATFINSSINTLPEHAGLGRISRAEAVAALASIERRGGP